MQKKSVSETILDFEKTSFKQRYSPYPLPNSFGKELFKLVEIISIFLFGNSFAFSLKKSSSQPEFSIKTIFLAFLFWIYLLKFGKRTVPIAIPAIARLIW